MSYLQGKRVIPEHLSKLEISKNDDNLPSYPVIANDVCNAFNVV